MYFLVRRWPEWAICWALALAPAASAWAIDAVDNPVLKPPGLPPLPNFDAPPTPPGQVLKAGTPRVFPRPGLTTPRFVQPVVDPIVTTQTRQALSFYGGYSARQTLSQQPRRTPIRASAPRPLNRQLKPFQSIYATSTVSPYLNLHRDDANSESAPNYFSLVRPQLEQIEAARSQQRELQQLRGQLQTISSTVVRPQGQGTGLPGTGTSARYMDTAQFYGGGLRR